MKGQKVLFPHKTTMSWSRGESSWQSYFLELASVSIRSCQREDKWLPVPPWCLWLGPSEWGKEMGAQHLPDLDLQALGSSCSTATNVPWHSGIPVLFMPEKEYTKTSTLNTEVEKKSERKSQKAKHKCRYSFLKVTQPFNFKLGRKHSTSSCT